MIPINSPPSLAVQRMSRLDSTQLPPCSGRTTYRQRHPAPVSEEPSVFAQEPLASLYILWRGLTSFILLPFWAIYYSLAPRPRSSWSLKQALQVAWMRHVVSIPERTNRPFHTRDPQASPPLDALKETSFAWLPPLPAVHRTGVLLDDEVDFQERIGTFVWDRREDKCPVVLDEEGTESKGLIGLCLHGGALVHMNASEHPNTARIPRRLIKGGILKRIYSVEYRLIGHTAFPGFLQDAASAYAHLVRDLAIPPERIILIGDSAGGNVALGLCRWLRDEAPSTLGLPGGLLLLSPWSDPSHCYSLDPASFVERPHGGVDYLLDEPAPRSLLVHTLLGHHPHSLVHSPYISPACAQLAGQPGLFANFPPTFVHYGGAERLEREIETLLARLALDDVPLTVVRSADAVHDVLILAVWDEQERDAIWRAVDEWLRALLREQAALPCDD